jgi:hypothetical protein
MTWKRRTNGRYEAGTPDPAGPTMLKFNRCNIFDICVPWPLKRVLNKIEKR